MWWFILLAIIGLCAGFAVAGGIFAFISMIGIPPRLAGRTHTASHIHLYETVLMLGAAAGNFVTVWNLWLPGGRFTLGVTGIFSGIFVGCMAIALAECLKAIPVFLHRISLKKGLPFIVAAMALGKLCGALLSFFG